MLHFPELEQFGVIAAMSDKTDGDCSREAPAEAGRSSFLAQLGIGEDKLILPKQIHGNCVHVAWPSWPKEEQRWTPGSVGEADALAAAAPGWALGVTVADCVPVLLVSLEPRAIAVVHAGREGTRQHITSNALATLVERFGAVPAGINAVIGPSAGPCCYEVSPALAESFAAGGFPVRGRFLDLWAANQLELVRAGVPAEQVHVSGLCTICSGRFHSFRTDKTGARNLALISLRIGS
ncbi:MAG: laccase domain-containing protein [Candidatus Hydrogenedentes bacterium]|nr:laccase domain-containing protein [Candidatus Hydrogenedentota bacterium]